MQSRVTQATEKSVSSTEDFPIQQSRHQQFGIVCPRTKSSPKKPWWQNPRLRLEVGGAKPVIMEMKNAGPMGSLPLKLSGNHWNHFPWIFAERVCQVFSKNCLPYPDPDPQSWYIIHLHT